MQNKILKLGATGTVLVAAAAIGAVYLVSNMRTVPAGYVGVRVNLYADKGVDNEVVGTGRYFLGFNEQLFKFPTFNQLISYEEPFTFQTSDAMDVRARVGVEYNITPEKAATIFQTYRKGIDDITEINLRQYISDALIKHAAEMDINALTQGGKTALLEGVLKEIRSKLDPVGIRIVKLSWVTDLIYPEQVKESINAKIEATQRALLRENEVAQSKAEAQKLSEEQKGVAESTRLRAQAEADAIAIKAKAEADAIEVKAKALRSNSDVIVLNAIEKWDGKLPQMMTGASPLPMIQVNP